MKYDRLDLVSKLFQDTLWPTVLDVAHGGRSDAPLVVDLDPTTFCDLACPECISGQLLNTGRFSRERLVALAGELIETGVRAVVLIGGGEPLAHPGTRDVLSTLGGAGVHVGIVTNGTLVDRHLTELGEYTRWVRVSVDAATCGTYGRFRPDRKGRSVFDRVIANMRMFAALPGRGALGYSFLVMTRRDASGVVVETNHREVLAAAELARDIGCDYFEVKTMFDEGHHVVDLGGRIAEELRDQVERARLLADDGFAVIASSTFEAVQSGVAQPQPKDYTACGVAELRTLVTPHGVFVCSYHRGNPDAALGDPVTTDFRRIWRESDRGIIDPSRDCGFQCARHQTNLELERIRDGVSSTPVSVEFDRFL